MEVYFYPRAATDTVPAGMTVSKQSTIPKGDFRITEYSWGPHTLWFVDDDKFTADERQAALEGFLKGGKG